MIKERFYLIYLDPWKERLWACWLDSAVQDRDLPVAGSKQAAQRLPEWAAQWI